MKSKRLSVVYSMWLFIFVALPLFMVVFFTFTDISGNFTMQNVLHVGKYSQVFIKSLIFGAIATAICLLLGYPFAYALSKLPPKSQGIITILIMLPMWMNFLLRTYAWMTILETNGILNSLLANLHLPKIQIINTWGAVVLGMVYNFLPYMILPIYSVVVKLDKKIIEAAQDLGANRFYVFSKIILPLSIPGIVSGITMVFVPAVSTFIISKMLGGGSNILIGDLIEMQFLGNAYNPNLGAAISLVLMVLILICMGILQQYDKEENKTYEFKGR